MAAENSGKNSLSHVDEELTIGNPESTREPKSAREPEPTSHELASQQLASISIEELRERAALIN